MTLHHTRRHYQAQTREAEERAFIEQLRRVQQCRADATKASTLCQSDDYERVPAQLEDETGLLAAMGRRIGVNVYAVAEALL